MRKTMKVAVLAAVSVGVVIVARQACKPHATRAWRRARGRVHGLAARTQYWIEGGHPDPDVPAPVLADRVRSMLGPVVARLDVPHPHVLVEGHVVKLHGEVATEHEAAVIENAVAAMPGVDAVESYLAVGLLEGDTRPSEGRRIHPPSAAMRRLLASADHAGVPFEEQRRVAGAVLAALATRLPTGERSHFLQHLPHDVRLLASGSHPMRAVQTEEDIVEAVVVRTAVPHATAAAATAAILGSLRELVPEEVADIAAVLPLDLREAWLTAIPS